MNAAEFANIAAAEQQFWWYRGMQKILFRVLDRLERQHRFRRAVDAGCGTGFLAGQLRKRYGWSIVPVDLGSEGLAYARASRIPDAVQADIAAMPFASSSFDLLLSMDVIVHFPRGEEHRPFHEFARILKPGGTAVVRVSALDVLRSRHSEFAHERQRFTRRRLLELAERHGFTVERCSYVNTLLLPVALAKFRVWEPLSKQPPASGVHAVSPWLDRVLHAPLALEARWLGAGMNLPLGQSLLLIARKRRDYC